jgi:hypothetical protein
MRDLRNAADGAEYVAVYSDEKYLACRTRAMPDIVDADFHLS